MIINLLSLRQEDMIHFLRSGIMIFFLPDKTPYDKKEIDFLKEILLTK
tara:strand:- start:484 stop:627 length:144 start_codon:yes stop_codon:yes gene_type:complete